MHSKSKLIPVGYKTNELYKDRRNELFNMIKKNPRKYGIDISRNVFQLKDFHEWMIDLGWKYIIEIDSNEGLEIIEPDEVIEHSISLEELYKLEDICDMKVLKIIHNIPTCGKKINQGIKGQQPFTYDRSFNAEKIMSKEDIINTCDQCKQMQTYDKRMIELLNTVSKLTKGRKGIIYACRHNNHVEAYPYTLSFDSKFNCPIDNRNVRIDRTCQKKHCQYLWFMEIYIPPMDIPESEFQYGKYAR